MIFENFARNRVACETPKLLEIVRRVDFAHLKVFEFGWLVNSIFEDEQDMFEDARAEGLANYEEAQFRLPFPECAFTWNERPDEAGRNEIVKEQVLLLQEYENSEGKLSITLMKAVRVHGLGPIHKNWIVIPGIAIMFPTEAEWAKCSTHLTEGEAPDTEQRISVNIAHGVTMPEILIRHELCLAAGNVVGLAALLARPGSVLDTSVTSKSSNALRRSRGFRPLPDLHRVVSLTKVSVRHASSGHEGSAKAPHDRRSHQRRLPSGKTISVRSSKIHGGSRERTIYDVVE